MSEEIMKVSHLTKQFKVGRGKRLTAVDNVSFTLRRGETLGIVGESGCGKTTLGRTLMGIYEPTSGSVEIDGKPVDYRDRKGLRQLSEKMQMIFQDPYASLNPRMTISEIICEGWNYHRLYSREKRHQKMIELLRIVGMNEEHASRFPHEFSGGQRQRIGIARALSMNPQIMICDEPISALDVSIQAQVMNLLINLQKANDISYLFIAHDLSMVRYISGQIMVMYLGTQMEMGASADIFHHGVHPYTEALFSAIALPDPDDDHLRNRIMLEGEIPSPINTPKGCKFCTRCHYAKEKCRTERPELVEVAKGHFCACHYPRMERLG